MARKISFKRDRKLSLRMYLTMFGIGLLYVALGVALWQFGLGWYYVIPIILLFSVLQIWFSDRIILGASGAQLVTPEQEPRLHALVDKLVERAQLPKPKVAVINSAALNAFATGKSPKSALVAVTKGLMQLLNEEELEGVLAHELGHIKQRDILVVGIANFLVAVTSFLSTIIFWNLLFGGGRNRDNGSAPIFLLYLVVLLVYFVGQMLVTGTNSLPRVPGGPLRRGTERPAPRARLCVGKNPQPQSEGPSRTDGPATTRQRALYLADGT